MSMQQSDLLTALPTREGHFLLESGYHTNVWLTLDALFVDPHVVAPLVGALAERIRPYAIAGVCGPFVGGAILAQALSITLGVSFYYAEPVKATGNGGLFTAQYRLPPALQARVRGQRVAVVDEVISAGSSARATIAALDAAGASTIVVGTLLLLGTVGSEHFEAKKLPVETLAHRDFGMWKPEDCPLCTIGTRLEDPVTH